MRSTSRKLFAAATLTFACLGAVHTQTVGPDGIIRVRSNYSVDETVARIRADITAKGILFFQAVDQAQLAAKAGIKLRPLTLLEFGNPPLRAQSLTANPNAGLDWPVRLLVTQVESGTVWAAWTGFAWIAKRHGITDRKMQSDTATGVVQSITSTVMKK